MCCYVTFVVFSDHFPALIDSLARMFAHALLLDDREAPDLEVP